MNRPDVMSARAELLKARLLAVHEQFPIRQHPLWQAVASTELSLQQVLKAEGQHYIRTRAGQELRKRALHAAQLGPPSIRDALFETYLEECTNEASGPSHLELIERLLLEGGVATAELREMRPTPGNAAAIALYRDITDRGAALHLISAGVVEYFYAQLAPKVFDVYTTSYGMSASQAETYAIHGPLDSVHADRAFKILPAALDVHSEDDIVESVRDAFVATSMHYDGMLQAATDAIRYWGGAQ